MKTLIKSILVAAVASVSVSVQAVDAVEQAKADKVLAAMRQARPDIPFAQIYPSPIDGVYRVPVGNQTLYVSEDGKHFIAGNLIEVTPTGFVDPLEVERTEARMELVNSIKVEDLIIYKAKGETRAHINVFTDIDCGYCRKLHRQMDEMNAQGIEVRYLAYPRAGISSPSFDKLATAWCSENQQEAMDKLKNREALDMKVCKDNPVAEQLLLGGQMGVTGTPALVLADGRLVPGYMPTADLLKKLGLEPLGDNASESSQ